MPLPLNPTVEIRYGNDFSSDYFTFTGMPTPYLSRSQEMVYYGGKWCQIATITLDGQIIGSETGLGGNLNTVSIKKDRERILSGFAESYKHLAIYEDGTTRHIWKGCLVRDLNFSPANYGAQEYSITLECFEQDEFAGTFGVLEPQETVSFNDNENGTVGISHTVSAQGFTSNEPGGGAPTAQAVVNAKNFVEARTGYNINKVIPKFVNGITNANLVLTNTSKDVNRVDGTYSCTNEYVIQTGSIGDIPITAGYVSEIDSSVSSGVQSDFLEVTVNYTIQGDKFATPASVRSSQPTTGNLYKIATGACKVTNLNQVPLSLDVEDTADTDKRISVSASYDNNLLFSGLSTEVYFDYNVDVSTDDITDRATVSINGQFQARGNNRAKFDLISGYYFNTILNSQTAEEYLFQKAEEIYTGLNYNILYSNTGWALNPQPSSFSVDMNEYAGTISLNASFDNNNFKEDFRTFQYKVDVTPALNQYVAKPSCNENGVYGIYNLNAKTRERVNLNITSKAVDSNSDFKTEMRNYSDSLRNSFTTNNDLVIESEGSNFNPIATDAFNISTFDSSITQSYTFVNNTSFYQ
jgi:hypothetical protein